MKVLILDQLLMISCVSDTEVNISANTQNTPRQVDPDNPIPEENTSLNEDSPTSVSLIFEEDFQYTLSDNSTIDTNFLTDSTFTSKWDTYSSTHELKSNNNSIAWSATGSSWWGASIITKQTFNLPITIEWYLENKLGTLVVHQHLKEFVYMKELLLQERLIINL